MPSTAGPLKLLFAKRRLAWPRSTGHDNHTYHLMRACERLGHDVWLAVSSDPSSQALDGLRLRDVYRYDRLTGDAAPSLTRLQRRFQSYFGVTDRERAGLIAAARQCGADAVIVCGAEMLPHFVGMPVRPTVWFAADELVRQQLSQFHWRHRSTYGHVKQGAIFGAYERCFARHVDGTWMVSDEERFAARWLAGLCHTDVVPLGVDADFFAPGAVPAAANSAVFWGRLDFPPNIEALRWFFEEVWPHVVAAMPQAAMTVIGYQPGAAVQQLTARPGVTLLSNVPDLRTEVHRHSLAVFPFISGGGMKNKVLEAAAMGMPTVCTPRATSGLHGLGSEHPFAIARSARQFAEAIVALWANHEGRRQYGASARTWAVRHHSWSISAQHAMSSLERLLARRHRQRHLDVSTQTVAPI